MKNHFSKLIHENNYLYFAYMISTLLNCSLSPSHFIAITQSKIGLSKYKTIMTNGLYDFMFDFKIQCQIILNNMVYIYMHNYTWKNMIKFIKCASNAT